MSDADADELARSVLSPTDLREMDAEGLSPHEYVKREYHVEAARFHEEDELRNVIHYVQNNQEHFQDGSETDDATMTENSDTDELARTVLHLADIRQMKAEGLSPREYVKREYGVDPAKYHEESALRDAVQYFQDQDQDDD